MRGRWTVALALGLALGGCELEAGNDREDPNEELRRDAQKAPAEPAQPSAPSHPG
jgi:hypothetical protein